MFAKENRKSDANRKPFDPVLMMRVFFLQRLHGLSDKQIEYQVKDRMNFREFLDIENVDDIPDENTVWKYEDMPAKTGTWDRLFAKFTEHLDSLGLIVNEEKIIDARFVTAPRQRTDREEDKRIKAGKGGSLWKDRPHKKCHKDVDARWAKKRGETHFGYKAHVVVCRKTKFVRDYEVPLLMCTTPR